MATKNKNGTENLDIDSSALASAVYDNNKKELFLLWKGSKGQRRWYKYNGVQKKTADDLENAGSQGRYANKNVRLSYLYNRM